MASSPTAPAITTLQLDAASIGNIGGSVNLFRGDVTFPLTFVSLPGPNGLDVTVKAVYGSNVGLAAVSTNRDAPTGLVGLGWSLPLDQITRHGDTAGQGGAGYALATQGASTPLLPLGEKRDRGRVCVELATRQLQAWRVLYFPELERWEVVHENGVRYVYGDRTRPGATVQWAIARDAWIGDSSRTDGAARVAMAWNLAAVEHPWGDALQFHYEEDAVAIGGDPRLRYTRASRPRTIVDAYGRVTTFHYLPKEACEVAPPHAPPPRDAAPGYQDRFDPHYLSAITVAGVDGGELVAIHLGYELAAIDGDLRGRYCKRYLASVAQTTGSRTAPGARFRYRNAPRPALVDGVRHPDAPVPDAIGALAGIDYPGGATVHYRYGVTEAAGAPPRLTPPFAGAVPRVWFGADYVVVVWSGGGQLVVTAYTWNGTWVPWANDGAIATSLPAGAAGLAVAAATGFFAVAWTDESGVPALRLYQQEPGRAGAWRATTPSTSFPATTAGAAGQLVAGDDFVLYVPPGSSTIHRYTWDRTSLGWLEHPQTVSSSRIAVAARANLCTVMVDGGGTAALTLASHDGLGRWSTVAMDSIAVDDDGGAPAFAWSLGASFAIATFVPPGGAGGATLTYAIRAYHWDPAFTTVTCRYQGAPSMPMSLALPPLATRVVDAVAGNLGDFLRFDGRDWLQQALPCSSAKQGSRFAYGDDVAIATDSTGAVTAYGFDADRLAFTPITLASGAAGDQPPRPTVAGDTLTVGTAIYVRDPEAGWTALPVALPDGVNPASIANRAPAYVAYEVGTGTGATAGILLLRDGAAAAPVDPRALAGQRLFTGGDGGDGGAPGTALCGASAFVTYEGDSFDGATALVLHHVASGALDAQRHCPVVGLDVDDGYQTSSAAYAYDAAVATFDRSGTVAQYARAWTFPGTATAPADGAAAGTAPYGWTESQFFNGLDPATPGVFYPGRTADHYSLLAGNALCTRTFAAGGALVGCRLSRYAVRSPVDRPMVLGVRTLATIDVTAMAPAFTVAVADVAAYLDGTTATMPAALADAFAAAGYRLSDQVVVEIERTGEAWLLVDLGTLSLFVAAAAPGATDVQLIAGWSRGEETSFHPETGQPIAVRTFLRDAAGTGHDVVRAVTYAWEQTNADGEPAYPALRATHQLTLVGDVVETDGGAITARTVSRYDADWGAGPDAWSERDSYQALTAGATIELAPGTTPDPTQWRLLSKTVARTPRAAVLESIDASGVHTSTLYDRTNAVAIAQIQNASLAGGELAYYGAEPYEVDPGWTVGGAAPAIRDGHAHTGTRSIALPAGATATLARTVVPTSGDPQLVFTCRYATDPGFGADGGTAGITVSAGGVAAPVVALADTGGAWQLAFVAIDPVALAGPPARGAAPSTAITIAIANGKTTTALCLDELRLIPRRSLFTGTVYDPARELAIAALGHGAQATRTSYDGANAVLGAIASGGSPTAIASSWTPGPGALDPSSPGGTVSLTPAGPGAYADYRRTTDWSRDWTGDAEAWTVGGGALVHTRAATDTLTWRGPGAGALVLSLRIAPQAEVTQPITITCGAASIAWIPGTGDVAPGVWRRDGDASTDVAPAITCRLAPRWATRLDHGEVGPALAGELASRGVRLASSAPTATVITAGAQWVIGDPDAGQRYLVAVDGHALAVTRLTFATTDLLVAAGAGGFLACADGRPIAQAALTGAAAAPTITTAAAITIADVLVGDRPRVAAAYVDGCGRTVQTQALEAAACLVQATQYDTRGNTRLRTKTYRDPTARLGYRATAITAVDPTTGVMTGDCATYYAPGGGGDTDDGGYPYAATRYGAWPGAGAIEAGQPGPALAITSDDPSAHHTQRTAITASTAAGVFAPYGFASGDFQQTTITDADGQPQDRLVDRAGHTVAHAATRDGTRLVSTYLRDVAGHVTTATTPRAQATGTAAPQAPITSQYDFAGNLTAITRPDATAPTTHAYDRAGRLRFVQDAAGATAATPYVQYRTYDRLGRTIELGWIASSWSDAITHVDDPAWPTAADGARLTRRDRYDGDGTTGGADALGRLTARETGGGVGETFTYGPGGELAACTVAVAAWSDDVYTTTYAHDVQGEVASIDYPDGATRLVFGRDGLGRLATIGTAPGDASIARYTYTAVGAIATETLGAKTPLARTFTSTSAGWITAITDPVLSVALSYQPASGPPSSTARIAGVDVAYTGTGAPSASRWLLTRDSLGQLTSVSTAAGPSADLGVPTPIAYDDNGNLAALARDGAAAVYTYDGTTNRVVTDGSGATFTYDATGAITAATRAGFAARVITNVTYDPVTRLPTAVTAGGATVTYLHDGEGARVLTTGATTTLALLGDEALPLVELTRDAGGAVTTTTYVRGPRGLVRVTTGGAAYTVLGDHQSSTRALVDAGGALAATFDYDALGSVVRTTGDPSLVRYLYTGQGYDADTGLYDYRARLYDSHLGRFYATDPLAQYASPYCYAGNDPVGRIDPSGLWSLGLVSPHTLTAHQGVIASAVEVVVAGLEILAGAVLLFVPAPGSRVLAGALLGAGVRGMVYGALHWGSTELSGGFLRGQVVGAAFGALGGFLARPKKKLTPVEGVLREATRDVANDTGTLAVRGLSILTGDDLSGLAPAGSRRRRLIGAGTIGVGLYVAPYTTLTYLGLDYTFRIGTAVYRRRDAILESAARAANRAIGYVEEAIPTTVEAPAEPATEGWFAWGFRMINVVMSSGMP